MCIRDRDETEIPANLVEMAQEYRQKMVEAAAEADDELMMKYLDGEELTTEEIKYGIRKATIDNKMTPVPVSYTHLDVYKRQAQPLQGVHGSLEPAGRPAAAVQPTHRAVRGRPPGNLSLIHI